MNEVDNPRSPVIMCDGELRAWIEQETVHLKAVDSHGDPIELSADEVRRLAQELAKLAKQIG
jgi:hypothetical protein